MPQQSAVDDETRDGGPLRLMTALGLAAVIAVVTFVLTSDGGDVVTAPAAVDAAAVTETTLAPATTTTTTVASPAVAPEPEESVAVESPPAEEDGIGFEDSSESLAGAFPAALEGGGDASMSSMPAYLSGQITNMGPTEIGFITNFPTTDYTWERIEVAGPGLADTGWLGELDGRMVAVGAGATDGSQALVTATSDDGLDWEQAGSFDLPDDMWIVRIVGDGETIYAVGQGSYPGDESGHRIYSTTDAVEWATAELPFELGDDEHAYIQSVVAGPAGVALAVGFETYPGEPPVVLTFEEYEVTLDHMKSTYTVIAISSGEEVLSGKIDDLFHWNADGQTIYAPETGEILTVVPWEVWERGWGGPYGRYGSSPLPIPLGSEEPPETPGVTIEYDGYVITIDDFAGEYAVADAETGEEIAAGTLDELYQGPAPKFVDPNSGEVLLAVTWDEWRQAEERGWQSVEYGGEDYFYRSRTGLMTSPDGENWTTEIVNEGSGGASAYLAATDDGFVAMMNSYAEFGEHGEVWTMVDGVWSSEPSERTDLWLRSLVTTSSGLLGVGEGSGGPALWSSPDGVTWTSEFAIVPQDDGTHAHLSSVAEDADTIAALAVRERWSVYQPLEIVQDKYTATFEEGDAIVRVSLSDSGEQVLLLTWEDVDSGRVDELVTWEDGATTIDLGDGEAMVILDDDVYVAMDALYAGSNEIGLSVFLDDGSGWTEAVVDVDGEISGAAQLFLADGKMYIGGSYWGEEGYYRERSLDSGGESTFVVIVGTPAGG